MKIISITGTKGKTTVTRALSHIIHALKNTTLRVDTDGYYINEKLKGTIEESKKLFSLVPTVCPGKYLILMKPYFPDFTAIFETALGSSGAPGLGYGLHQIGIFTNVLEDHLGSSARLKRRADLAKAKRFIFSRIDVGGFLIFNADDRYVCSQIKFVPEHRKAKLIPVGLSFSAFDIKKHLKDRGVCFTVADDWVVLKSRKKNVRILKLTDVYWTFNGLFLPSVYNLLFILGGIYAYSNGRIPNKAVVTLKKYRLDQAGGRLTLLKNKSGVKILIDYAHEKYSLREVSKLAKKMTGTDGKTIGVVRLAPDRPDKVIFETGQFISNDFGQLIVYDKIDGVNRKRYVGKKSNIIREAGEVSQIFFKGISSRKKNGLVERIIIEDGAIKKASGLARPGDVVVVICGDDHKKTIASIKKYFRASFAR